MDKIIGKVDSINKGPNYCNTTISLEDKKIVNLKLNIGDDHHLTLGNVYVFEVESYLKEEQTQLKAISWKSIKDSDLDSKDLEHYLQVFYQHAPLPILEMRSMIENYLNKIENKVLFDITKKIYDKYQSKFFMHPAATKFHHAYVGGLAYHTTTMLKMIEPLASIYTYLNKDLLFAATILHDVTKIDEMTGVDGEYTKDGLLLGHLVMGAIEVEKAATELGVNNTEEALLLKHLVISHHGQLNFGSPKKPQTGEALLLWFIDTIDSKFNELGDALNNTNAGEFTQSINVLDKMRFYKPKL